MSDEEEKTNEFFEQLRGKPSLDGSPPGPGITAMRVALQAQLETMRSAETVTEADLDEDEKARMAAIKQQLIDRGLLGGTIVNASSRFTDRPRLLKSIRDTLLGDSWHRPVALAASLMFGILVIIEIALPPPDEDTIVRGATSSVIVATDPAVTAQLLAVKLRGAGAQVLSVQINATEWSMRIDVPKTVELTAIQKILSDRGVAVVGPPPYQVSVKTGH